MTPRDLAIRLYSMRKAAQLSQPQLSALSGIGFRTISSFESGRRASVVRFFDLMAMVEACGWTMEDFVAPQFFVHLREKHIRRVEDMRMQRAHENAHARKLLNRSL